MSNSGERTLSFTYPTEAAAFFSDSDNQLIMRTARCQVEPPMDADELFFLATAGIPNSTEAPFNVYHVDVEQPKTAGNRTNNFSITHLRVVSEAKYQPPVQTLEEIIPEVARSLGATMLHD